MRRIVNLSLRIGRGRECMHVHGRDAYELAERRNRLDAALIRCGSEERGRGLAYRRHHLLWIDFTRRVVEYGGLGTKPSQDNELDLSSQLLGQVDNSW